MKVQQDPIRKRSFSKQMNKAIIVSQSFSEELEPLNIDMPAILLPVGNVPVIDILLKHLLTYGITTIHVIGSKTQYVEKHIRQQQQYSKMSITYHIYEAQNNIELLANFFKDNPGVFGDNNDDYCYLFNGPIVTNVNLHAAMQIINQKPSANLVLTQKLRGGSLLALPEAPFQMVLGEDGRLLGINRANKRTQAQTLNLSGVAAKQKVDVTLCQQPSQIYLLNYQFMNQMKSYYMQNCGTMTITAFLEWICPQPDKPLDIYTYNEGPEQLTCVIASMRQYRGCCRAYLKRYFYPHGPGSGNLPNLDNQAYQSKYQRQVWQCGSPEVVVGPGTQVYRDAKLEGQCIIGNGCIIKGYISGCQVQDNCSLDSGSSIKNCVVMDRVCIRPQAKLEACILMSRCIIEQNIVLPRGSIVGTDVVVTWKLVQAAVRFYLLYIWDATHQGSHHLYLGDREMDEVKTFLAGQSDSLQDHIIERLPPIFLMCQEISSKDKELRSRQQRMTTSDNFWQYQLCDMQESRTKKTRDDSIREQQRRNRRSYSYLSDSITAEQFTSKQYQSQESLILNEQFVVEEAEEVNDETEENETDIQSSDDQTEPAKLAQEILNSLETQKDDDCWVPNYVIRLAKRIRDAFDREINSVAAEYNEENKKDLFKRISAEVSRRVLGQGLRNSFSVLQQTHNDIIVQSVFSKQMKQFLRNYDVKPEINSNEVIYNTQELISEKNNELQCCSAKSNTKLSGESEPQNSDSNISEEDLIAYHIRNDAILKIERRQLKIHGSMKQYGKLHKQRVLLLERKQENIQIQILQILQRILRDESFIRNEINVNLVATVRQNLQQLKRVIPVNEQAQDAFRSQTLRTLLLITLNDTDGVDKEGNVIIGRQNINQPVEGSAFIFQKLLEFMCHGDTEDSMLVDKELGPSDACMYVIEDISTVMVQTGLNEEIEHLKLGKAYLESFTNVGLLDKQVLLEEYMPDYQEEFETDQDTELYQQHLFQTWDEL